MITAVFSAQDEYDSKKGALIPLGETGFSSTAENLTAEYDLLTALRMLRSKTSPLEFPGDWLRKKRLNYYEFKKDRMDATELSEQLKVVYDELTSHERVALITGPPGAAKTVVAMLWVKLAREHTPDLPVVLITQERPALNRLHEKLGFQEAQLMLLSDVLKHNIALKRGAAVIIDEAGLLGTQDLANLLAKIAEADPQKLILIGDDKQLLPVNAGQPFRWIRERKKASISELSFPYRQKDPVLRQIVLDLYAGRITQALEQLAIDFVPHEDMLKKARGMIDALAPEKSLTLIHGNETVADRLKVFCPGYRIYSLAAAQGLAVDQAVLVLADTINLSEFLVGCSRARHELRVIVDADVYPSMDALHDAIDHYPKKMMALDLIDEQTLSTLI